MRNESVAALDIRSDEICSVIAEKGVNNTFIIKSKYSVPYDGYAEGEFLDVESFVGAVRSVFGNLVASSSGKIRTVYVGVPCEFIETVRTDKILSFHGPHKIAEKHLAAVEKLSTPKSDGNYTVIASSPLYYCLSDKRRLLNPLGSVSDSLRARLCFYTCNNYFMNFVRRAFGAFPAVKNIIWVPQNYAEAYYLFGAEQKNGYSLLFDFGYISSTFSVVCGNAVAFSEAFSIGVGHLYLLLMEALEIPYPAAEELAKKVNLNAKERLSTSESVTYDGEMYSYPSSKLRDILKEGLDGVCETIEACIQSFKEKNLSGFPVYITGEGAGVIRGASEHIASRLVTAVETAAPPVPYYNKPKYSSLLSLLSVALDGVCG